MEGNSTLRELHSLDRAHQTRLALLGTGPSPCRRAQYLESRVSLRKCGRMESIDARRYLSRRSILLRAEHEREVLKSAKSTDPTEQTARKEDLRVAKERSPPPPPPPMKLFSSIRSLGLFSTAMAVTSSSTAASFRIVCGFLDGRVAVCSSVGAEVTTDAVLSGHEQSVTAVGWSGSGESALSCSLDRTCRIWSLDNNSESSGSSGVKETAQPWKCLRVIYGTSPLSCGAFFPLHESYCLCGIVRGSPTTTRKKKNQTGAVRMHDVRSGTVMQRLEYSGGPVTAVSVSREGLLAFVSECSKLHVLHVSKNQGGEPSLIPHAVLDATLWLGSTAVTLQRCPPRRRFSLQLSPTGKARKPALLTPPLTATHAGGQQTAFPRDSFSATAAGRRPSSVASACVLSVALSSTKFITQIGYCVGYGGMGMVLLVDSNNFVHVLSLEQALRSPTPPHPKHRMRRTSLRKLAGSLLCSLPHAAGAALFCARGSVVMAGGIDGVLRTYELQHDGLWYRLVGEEAVGHQSGIACVLACTNENCILSIDTLGDLLIWRR